MRKRLGWNYRNHWPFNWNYRLQRWLSKPAWCPITNHLDGINPKSVIRPALSSLQESMPFSLLFPASSVGLKVMHWNLCFYFFLLWPLKLRRYHEDKGRSLMSRCDCAEGELCGYVSYESTLFQYFSPHWYWPDIVNPWPQDSCAHMPYSQWTSNKRCQKHWRKVATIIESAFLQKEWPKFSKQWQFTYNLLTSMSFQTSMQVFWSRQGEML